MNAPLGNRISIACFTAFALAFAGCSSRPSAPAAPPVVTGLHVAQAELQQIPATADAVGTVHASESAILSAQTTGRITAVLVKEGDQVRAGQLLVKLDDAQPHAEAERAQSAEAGSEHEVEVAQSESALANSTLARYKLLRERKSISPQEYDEVERRAQVAAAQLEAARAQLASAHDSVTSARTVAGYSRLTAPFAGIVTARLMDPGSLAAPGAPLLEIDKAGTLQLDVTVDESLLSAVHQGMPLAVNIAAASAQPLKGRIAAIVPAADPGSHSFLVKIDLPSSRNLRAGMYGTAAIRERHPRRRFWFRAPPWFCAVRWPAPMFSTATASHNFATSRWARRKAISWKFSPASRPAKSWSTLPPTVTLPASASRLEPGSPAMNAGTWNRRAPGARIYQLQADAAVHCRVAGAWNLRGGYHSARGRAADSRSHAGHYHRHAGRIAGGSRAARHAAHRECWCIRFPASSMCTRHPAPGQSLVIVRFLVGTPQEDALIKVYSKLYSNFDRMPPGVSQPIIKARSIDDVPILSLTLWGEHYNGYQLRAIADEVQHNIQQISDVSETSVIGGLPRTMRVVLSTAKLNAYGLSPHGDCRASRRPQMPACRRAVSAENNQEIRVDAGNLFTSTRRS